ncbi:MAG: T9SS type A sorting domain-containing protein [Bacteroidales bacterium]|nr:T9SS type A sorting domain-containing protein [Bacteroidales bacterium]
MKNNIMRKLAILLSLLFINSVLSAQEWVNSTAINSNGSVVAKELLLENGNIYTTGIFSGSIGDSLASYGSDDWFIAKHSSDFSINWIKRIGSAAQERDVSMSFDSNKDILIGGSFRDNVFFTEDDSLVNVGLYDVMLAKYDHLDGSLIWKKTIAWGTTGQLISSIDVDDNDEIIVAGFYKDSLVTNVDTLLGTGFQNYILKLDANGDFLWIKNILSSNVTTGTRIGAVSAFTDAYYVNGTYRDNIYFDNDTLNADVANKSNAFVYKLAYDGTSQWARSSYGKDDDASGTIAQDLGGNIYISGYYRSTDFRMDSDGSSVSDSLVNNGGSDLFIAKYNASGNLLWLQGYGKAGSDYAIDIKEKEGIIYFTGYYSDSLIINLDTLFNSGTANKDIFLATADSDGNLLKGEALNGIGVFDDFGVELEITDATHAILFGDFYSTSITIGSNTLTNTVSPSSQSFIAEYAPPFSAQYTSIKEVTCNGGSDGELIVTPYFGVSPYSYTWSNSAPNDSTASNLSAGITYTVTVTDALASEAIAEYTIIEPGSFIFNPIITPVTSCSDSLEGVIDLNVTGGNGGDTYYWVGSGTELTAEDQDSLAIGTYSVTVTDSETCAGDTTINITGPQEIHFGNSDTTSYYGAGSEGAVDLEVTGGTGTPSSYAASWTGTDGYTNTVQDIITLQPGTYNVTVTDENSCIEDTSFVIVNKFEFSSYIESKKDACNGVSNGRATVNYHSPIGHTAITYLWDANTGDQSTAEATGLTGSLAGIKYYVTITDTEEEPDVEIVDSVIIYEFAYTFSGTLEGTNVNCKDDSDGIINLTTENGIAPYIYSWSNGKNTEDINSLPPDFYSVTATDDNECTFSIVDYEITEPELLVATAGIENELQCNGNYNGAVRVSVEGGNGDYTYEWDDQGSQSTPIAINLGTGLYNVTVNDSKGCNDTSKVLLTEPEVLSVSGIVANLDCFEDAIGAIDVTVLGGTISTVYTYNWSTADGSGEVVDSEDQSGLGAGTYNLTVTDDNLCEITDNYIVIQPAEIVITDTTNVDITACNGDNTGIIAITASGGTGVLNYTLNPDASQTNNTGIFTGLGAGFYTVDVDDENGCGLVTSDPILISEPTSINIVETSVVNLDCNGDIDGSIDVTVSGGVVASVYSYSWTTLDGTGLVTASEDQLELGAGTYDLTVTDNNLCTATTTIILSEPSIINLDNSNNINPSCNGSTDGSIDITISGGTIATAYTYNWATMDGSGLVADSQDQTNLSAGTYDVTVTDDNSCASVFEILLEEPVAITIDSENSTDATSQTAADGTVTVTASGGTGTLDYEISSGGAINQTGIFTGLVSGDYTVEVTDDNSCGPVTSDTITVGFANAIEDVIAYNKIKIYPNPTSDKIFIEIDYEFDNLKIEILSISGQVLLSKEMESHGITKEELDLSSYPKGVYFVRIYNNTFNFKDKILLQ